MCGWVDFFPTSHRNRKYKQTYYLPTFKGRKKRYNFHTCYIVHTLSIFVLSEWKSGCHISGKCIYRTHYILYFSGFSAQPISFFCIGSFLFFVICFFMKFMLVCRSTTDPVRDFASHSRLLRMFTATFSKGEFSVGVVVMLYSVFRSLCPPKYNM